MLEELVVRDLGVIRHLELVLGPGMTALTGETGAGKTLLVEALQLLTGSRADSVLVRPGAKEAAVEGRFSVDGREVVARRVVPADGRSRAYLDGRLATAAELSEATGSLVDLHGQHSHQTLLATSAQRSALDGFGSVDLSALQAAAASIAEVDRALADLGGDEASRAREMDLLGYQRDEIDAAAIADPDEDEALTEEEDRLADAVAHREAGAAALAALDADGGARSSMADALREMGDRRPFAETAGRLSAATAELDDLISGLRAALDGVEPDPERLEAVRSRRQLLRDLRRKYGEDLAEVAAFGAEAARRRDELASHGERVETLTAEREVAAAALAAAEAEVGAARRRTAPALAEAVQAHLTELAMPKARLAVEVGEDPGDDVELLLAANPGGGLLPLRKVASGGELARTMLALRLVLTAGPPVLVFDEVDSGIGGSAATAVGQALGALGSSHQVLVVTHLPQVAACADAQVSVSKSERDGATEVDARVLDDEARAVELSRMLSGSPDSDTARRHAEELLAAGSTDRRR